MACMDPRKETAVSFVEVARGGTILADDLVVRVLEALGGSAHLIADCCLKTPSEFWAVWNLWLPAVLELNEAGTPFDGLLGFWKRLGVAMLKADPTTTTALFHDVVWPQATDLLTKLPGKRDGLCELIYAFTQEAA